MAEEKKRAERKKKRSKKAGEGASPVEEKKSGRREYSHRQLPVLIPLVLVMLLFCFVMISPLNGCVIGSRDYIGTAAAAGIALDDSGISSASAGDLQTDMIMLDGEAYYKVQFSGTVTTYRYIIDAQSGEIVLQTFDHAGADE